MSISSNPPAVSNQLGYTDFPEEFEEFHDIFDREFRHVIDVVNTKENAYHGPNETITFQQFFSSKDANKGRNVYRKVLDFGPLPNSSSKSVPHRLNLSAQTKVTHLYGAATNPRQIKFIPLPFASPVLVENIKLEADQEVITITTAQDYSAFTEVVVIFEYTKD